jgi:hypothetical protein
MNKRPWWLSGIVVLALAAGGMTASSQPSPRRGSSEEDEPLRLPNDPRLDALHREFVSKSEKIAREFEHEKEFDKAMAVYRQILRLVPDYPPAVQAVQRIKAAEATADRKVLDVLATEGWQDTGIRVVEGKPFRILAKGTWVFRVSLTVGPDGIEIPEELRDFNLGALVGMIDCADEAGRKPFFIGSGEEQIARHAGPLLLRMYDGDPRDNEGKLAVEITGTFEREK